MANSGIIKQLQGPFGTEIMNLGLCRLGISMSEDDFMENENFSFILKG